MPEISIIILSFNTKQITLECLSKLSESIKFLKKSVETIVVENGNDGTDKVISKKYPWVKIIKPNTNTGYATGNNLGIKKANKRSKYLLFLNSDALVNSNTLFEAVNFAKKGHDVFGCQLKYSDGRVQPSAGYLPNIYNTVFWMCGLDSLSKYPVHPKRLSFFKQTKLVDWVMGAFLFMKREAADKTGGFDEKFFMYMEEVEWCRRIKSAGFKIWYTNDFWITHLDKASSKGIPTQAIIKEATGLQYYFKKYYPNQIGIFNVMFKLGMLVRSMIFGVLGNKVRAEAHWHAFKSL